MKTKPITLLAFDPSLHATGWAFFHKGNYWCSGVMRIEKKYKGTEAIFKMWEKWHQHSKVQASFEWDESSNVVVVEIQESRHRAERASANSILLLNGVCFGFLAMISAEKKVAYTPQQWKGTTPKKIHNLRVRDYIGGLDITDDNELDAIGLGLFYLTGKKL